MTVTGGAQVASALERVPALVRVRIAQAIEAGARLVLADMKVLTPRDSANPGPHAADGLTLILDEEDTRARVGLPTDDLASDYFWFRFLDGGTKGGEVTANRRGANGKRQRYTIKVPARAALRIRERALDANRDELRRLVAQAVAEGVAAT